MVIDETITTNGRPVMVTAYGDLIGSYQGPTAAQILTGTAGNLVGNTAKGALRLFRDSTGLGPIVTVTNTGMFGVWDNSFALSFIDAPAAGTYTYSLKALITGATCTFGNSDGPALNVYEIR